MVIERLSSSIKTGGQPTTTTTTTNIVCINNTSSKEKNKKLKTLELKIEGIYRLIPQSVSNNDSVTEEPSSINITKMNYDVYECTI